MVYAFFDLRHHDPDGPWIARSIIVDIGVWSGLISAVNVDVLRDDRYVSMRADHLDFA